ncbi:hypothetical protein [Thalassobius sp. I31.1]|uniref:hypothetical protein n=1 Tax=Thalassobius sp. I31.1 TaxID=2109912 RepID=UPI00130066E2|nr:hypothetical protein [Thalassobius sp. I31.1]
MNNEIRSRFPASLYRDLIIDLEDRLAGETLKASKMISLHSGLDNRRARALEGQARFRMNEQGFEQVCELHGGTFLPGGLLPNSEIKVHQPFMRFGKQGEGVILGLASMPQPSMLPVKNRSRLAGVSVNWQYSQELDLDGKQPKSGDVFILLLVARDPQHSGKLKELAVGAIDSGYDQFLYYEPIDKFLSGEIAQPTVIKSSIAPSSSQKVRLKTSPKTYIAPEAQTTPNTDSDTA